MYHLHFNTIDSTHIYLKDNLEHLKSFNNNILISAEKQTAAIGRRGNSWKSYTNSLAMSFTLLPNAQATLTPLEIGILAVSFFKKKFNKDLFLKWPNDILNSEGNKCGGIICHYIDQFTIIVGLGINLGKFEELDKTNFLHGCGAVDDKLELQALDQEKISKELYNHFLLERITNFALLSEEFDKACTHKNKLVVIHDEGIDHTGIFLGIENTGAALISINDVTHSFLSSSLSIKK